MTQDIEDAVRSAQEIHQGRIEAQKLLVRLDRATSALHMQEIWDSIDTRMLRMLLMAAIASDRHAEVEALQKDAAKAKELEAANESVVTKVRELEADLVKARSELENSKLEAGQAKYEAKQLRDRNEDARAYSSGLKDALAIVTRAVIGA